MEEIKRCSRCILPADLPGVTLDDRHICNICRNFDKIPVNRGNGHQSRRDEFEKILTYVRKRNAVYDCLIPLSGGKDSTYVLYLCAKVYGLRCLCVTFNNGYMSDYALRNIHNAVSSAGADHMFFTISKDTLLPLYRSFLKNTGQFCSVCMRGINLCIEKALQLYKIPLTISGDGARISYLNMLPDLYEGGDVVYFRNALAKESIDSNVRPLMEYSFPWKKVLFKILRVTGVKKQINRISIHDYFQLTQEDMIKSITHHMGWTKPEEHFEHIDCKLHEIPFYIHTRKFPFLSSETLLNSSLVRLGKLDREEALKRDAELKLQEKKPEILEAFLDDIGISETQFEKYISDPAKLRKYNDPLRVLGKKIIKKLETIK